MKVQKKQLQDEKQASAWKLGKGMVRGRFSVNGAYAMVVRRCASNCAAHTVGCAMGIDVSGKTVTRWEIHLRAAHNAATKAWYREIAEMFSNHAHFGRDAGWMFRWSNFKGDATNSGVFQRKSKLHATEVTTFSTREPVLPMEDIGHDFDAIWSQVLYRRSIPDVQVVTHNDAAGTFGIQMKQLQNIGATPPWSPLSTERQALRDIDRIAKTNPAALADIALASPHPHPQQAAVTWPLKIPDAERVPLMDSPEGPAPTRPDAMDESALVKFIVGNPKNVNSLDAWTLTTDHGSDEVTARNIGIRASKRVINSLVFENDRFTHQFQLIVKAGLAFTTALARQNGAQWGYINALSKIMLLWREKAGQILLIWNQLYGPLDPKSAVRRIAPKCIGSRWGQISRCENHVLAVSFSELLVIFEAVFVVTEAKPKRKFNLFGKRPAAAMKRPAATKRAPAAQQPQPEAPDNDTWVPDLIAQGHDDPQEYAEKMSKWSKDVMNALKDPRFIIMVYVANASRRWVDFFVHYLMKKRPGTEPQALSKLVWYKAQWIKTKMLEDLDKFHPT